MSKVKEFKVEIINVVTGQTKTKSFYAKNYDKLMKSMTKEIRKKWKTIRYIKEDVEIIIKREDVYT